MKTLLIIAWRNIWRHPGRSGVLIAAIIVGLWAGVVTVGTMNGMLQQRVSYLIDSEVTHLQIHNPEFLTERLAADYIPDHDEITGWLSQDERVRSFSPRVMADGMLQSPVKTSGVRIRGIDVEQESATTTFHENMIEGEYLDAGVRNSVVMGKSLMDEHGLRIGNRIVLTFEDAQGELTSSAFNITGIFRSASTEYDDRNLLVRKSDLYGLIAETPVFHEIAVMLHNEDDATAVVDDLNEAFPEITARTWRQISPELSTLIGLGGYMLYIVTLIIMAALAFGILNTMLMALFERMREIGMLISIGMSRKGVFIMIMMESVLLTLTGTAGGFLLAWLSIGWLGRNGVNFEAFADGIAELGWDHIVYPVISTQEYVAILLVVMFVTLLASLYPAFKAIRINPLEAAKDT